MGLKYIEKTTVCTIDDADEVPMIEATGVPEVYCDGIGAAEAHGNNVVVTYYALRRMRGEEVKVPVLIMTRPRHTCGAQVERLLRLGGGERNPGGRRDH